MSLTMESEGGDDNGQQGQAQDQLGVFRVRDDSSHHSGRVASDSVSGISLEHQGRVPFRSVSYRFDVRLVRGWILGVYPFAQA